MLQGYMSNHNNAPHPYTLNRIPFHLGMPAVFWQRVMAALTNLLSIDAGCKGTIPPQKTCSHPTKDVCCFFVWGENRHALISMSNVFFWFVVDRKTANTFAILMILLVYVDTGWYWSLTPLSAVDISQEQNNHQWITSWWFQPLWNIWVKMGKSSPKFRGEHSKHIWVATTQVTGDGANLVPIFYYNTLY